MNRPASNEFAPYYSTYIDTVSDNVMGELEHQAISFPEFLSSIPQDKAYYAYAEDKWTLKQVVGHVVDTERVMAYRLLRISRNDQTPIEGFDENMYVENACFNDRTLGSLAEEFASLRKANMYLYKSLTADQLAYMGTANNLPVSVRALLFILAGHVNHHRRVIEERYL